MPAAPPSIRRVVFLAICAMVVAGCGGDTVTEPEPVTGSIEGTVTLSGSPLSGATVTATWADSSSATVTVQASGAYAITGLSPGEYTVTVGGYGPDAGFDRYQEHTDIGPAGGVVTIDFTAMRIEIGVGLGLEQFTLVPAGTFLMGTPEGGLDWERPVHTVNITKPFYIQKTEVTQQQWTSVMGSNPSKDQTCGVRCPVDFVSWDDVQEFLERLNDAQPDAGFRLPTEAEWEYAARAGTTGDYSGTGVLDDMGWYDENAGGALHPVAVKLPNQWGLYDVHGNAWEWVADRWSKTYYSESPVDDPPGPAESHAQTRVHRGGSWYTGAVEARSGWRSYATGFVRGQPQGFRLVRSF